MSDMFPSGWWFFPVIYLIFLGSILMGLGYLIGVYL